MDRSELKKTVMIKGIMAGIAAVMILLGLSVIIGHAKEIKINRLLDLGEKYLEDMDYESAVLTFDQAIAIDPKCEEAYLGKAQALYALGQYEDAIETLKEGIEKVDDGSRLEEFLQQLLEELMIGEGTEVDFERIEDKKRLAGELVLNYKEIVRLVNTEEPEIQLEILGDEGGEEKYTWLSSDPECASVSQRGLVTCLPVEGAAVIYAEDESGNKSGECVVRIYSSSEGFEVNESETVRIRTDIEENQDFVISVLEKEGEEQVTLDILGDYVYYSGDVMIPEKLQFKGRELTVTGISTRAFRWGDELNTVYIPETMGRIGDWEYEVENPFYYCKNLKEIKVDPNNAFLKAVDGVLYSKDGTILYSYPAGLSAGSYILPKEVKKVCSGAFVGCSNLKEILVEEGNDHYIAVDGSLIEKDQGRMIAYPIGNGLTSYTVPDIVKYLDPNVFYSSILEEIDCNSVESIYDDAFRQCDALKRIQGGEKTVNIAWYNWYSGKAIEFTKLDTLTNLESFYITLSEEQDISGIASLRNLDTIHIEAGGLPLNLETLNGSSASVPN